MNVELNIILQQLLNRWLNSNIIKNFTLFELFVRLSKLSYNNQNKCEELIKTIAFIESNYSIPILAVSVTGWIEESESNKFIYDIYSSLSKLLNNERNIYGYR